MKRLISAAALVLAASAALAPVPALAWHGGHGGRVGVVIGGPVFGFGYPYGYGGYYGGYPYGGYPYGYAPPVVAIPAAPPVYVEQQSAPAAAPQAQSDGGFWYYCHAPAGYYPTVKNCPAGWQKVAPLPAQ